MKVKPPQEGATIIIYLRGFCLFYCRGSKDFGGVESAVDSLDGTLCRTDSAADALCLVDDVQLFQFSRWRIHRAYLCADPATDTIIHDKCLGALRYEIGNGVCRTFGNAEATDLTFFQIYPREVIFDRRGVKGTDLHTDAAGDASHLTVFPGVSSLIL